MRSLFVAMPVLVFLEHTPARHGRKSVRIQLRGRICRIVQPQRPASSGVKPCVPPRTLQFEFA
jgi:hypothetical protein